MVTGVAQVQVQGSKKYAVRVHADPERLASRQVGLEEIRDALSHQNVNLPAGSLFGWTKAYTIQSDSQMTAAAQFRPMIIAYRNGNPVRLDDVALVYDSVASERSTFWVDNVPSIILSIRKTAPGANTIEVADGVKRLLPGLREKDAD